MKVRHSIRRGLVLAALAGTALVATAPAAFAQTTSPEAFGIEGTGLLGLAPTPDATLANPNPANVATVGIPLILNAGTLSASVTTNTATAEVQSLNTTGIIAPLLGVITATAVESSCLANANGTFVESTTIGSLNIAGTALTPGTIPANDVFLNIPGIANITLNQQVTGPITGSVTVNAIHIALLGALVGETINIASSTCGPFSADTPIAGGKGLAVGLGLLGSVGVGYGAIYTRRRRTSVI
jgi:hypothetical protein